MSRARHSQQMCVRVTITIPTGGTIVWHSFQTVRTYEGALTLAREAFSHDEFLSNITRELPAGAVVFDVIPSVTRKLIREAIREDKKREKVLEILKREALEKFGGCT